MPSRFLALAPIPPTKASQPDADACATHKILSFISRFLKVFIEVHAIDPIINMELIIPSSALGMRKIKLVERIS